MLAEAADLLNRKAPSHAHQQRIVRAVSPLALLGYGLQYPLGHPVKELETPQALSPAVDPEGVHLNDGARGPLDTLPPQVHQRNTKRRAADIEGQKLPSLVARGELM